MTRIPAPDPAAGAPRPGRAARASVPGGPATSLPPEVAGGKTSRQAVSPDSLPGGRPGPETRRPGPVSVRAGDSSPPGAATVTARPPGGSTGRAFKVTLPAGLKLLSLNGREHWSTRNRRAQALKKAAWAMALQGKVPPLGRVIVIAEYRPPDRRRRDADNLMSSVKAAIDGIVAAGVIPDDECPRYVSRIACTIGEPFPKGCLVLHLIEDLEPVAARTARSGGA